MKMSLKKRFCIISFFLQRYARNLVERRYVFLLKYVVLESGLIFPFSYGLKVPIWLSTTRIILSLLLGSNSSQSLMHATVKPLGPLTGSSCLLTWHSRKSRVRMAIIGTSQSAQQEPLPLLWTLWYSCQKLSKNCMTRPKVLSLQTHYGNSHLEMGVWK